MMGSVTLPAHFDGERSVLTKSTEARSLDTDQELLNRIILNQEVLLGKPVVRGTRLTVEYILNLLAHGTTTAEILEEYNTLSAEDVRACILFASRSLKDSAFLPLEQSAH